MDSLYPAAKKLRELDINLSYELRDESMSRAVINFLCHQKEEINDIHIIIGSFHVEGIKLRLTKALAGSDFKIQVNDMMQEKSVNKPYTESTRGGATR